MKKILIICGLIVLISKTYAIDENSSCKTGIPTPSNKYSSVLWYRDSTEKKVLYREIFAIGLEKITTKVNNEKLKKGTWGVIFDIDETLLDNSQLTLNNIKNCLNYQSELGNIYMAQAIAVGTPGATNITCGIQKLGGRVILITNRDGSNHPNYNLQNATQNNLKRQNICFDSAIFANNSKDSNKNPRFNAAISGDYENIIVTNKLAATKIIAYFGDNIQDFPDFKQNYSNKLDGNDKTFDKFGQEYFLLPNPTYGSWTNNQLK